MNTARFRGWLPYPAMAAASLAAYWPALGAGYIWDDDGHVTRPDLRSVHGLWRIWFDLGATQQYYPVLHSAFWLEHRFWGDAPLGYHLINVLLHAAAACLFARVLVRLGRPGLSPAWAWFAAALFALHPVGVESVAWVSEEKNTLSTVFYLLAALAYLRWTERRSAGLYGLAALLFVLALLSKSVTATLPAALLVALWWRDGRLSWKRDIFPLAPWFAAAIVSGSLTAWVERTLIGAQGGLFALSLAQRFLLAGRIFWFYLGKLLWPADLIFIYPRWNVGAWPAWRIAFPLGALLLVAAAWLARRRTRTPLAALLFFLGTLFPALGFVNVYPFVFSYVADHFQYLASLGIFALAAGGWQLEQRTPAIARATGAALLAALGLLTWRQSRTYRDMETLYRATVEHNPASWLAQENLGVVLANQGRWPEAMARYREALRLNPDYAETHANYGNALRYRRRWPEAVAEYREALRLRPDFAPATVNWAQAEYAWASELGNAGDLAGAIAHYERALRLRPNAEVMAELGLAEAYSGRLVDAVAQLRQAVQLDPRNSQAHAYLGLAFAQSGRLREAVAEYQASLRLKPGDPDVSYHLEAALRALENSGHE